FGSSRFESLKHRAVQVRIKDEGMNVALFANGGSVPEALRHCFDGAHQIFLRLGFSVELFEFAQGHSGQNGPAPGTKILGGEIALSNLAQIRIHIGRSDVMRLAALIDILKKFLAWNGLAIGYDFRKAAVVNFDLMIFAALPPKLKTNC